MRWIIGDIIAALFIPVGKEYSKLAPGQKIKFRRNSSVYLLIIFIASVLCVVDFLYDNGSMFILPGIIGLLLSVILFYKLKKIDKPSEK